MSHDGADITTIEGVARGKELHPLLAAFITHDRFQCGFCTPGQIVSALGLINEGQAGDDPERIREGMRSRGPAATSRSVGSPSGCHRALPAS